jgi:formate hydrogenlyase transcriptional activator
LSDVPLLVNHFVAEFSRRDDKCIHTVASGVLEQLQAYDWPGNIRELEHVIERAVITSTDGVLYLIEPLVCENVETSLVATARLTDFERLHIERILSTTSWRIEGPAGAATALGLHPSTLRSRMIKLGIKRPEEPAIARRGA